MDKTLFCLVVFLEDGLMINILYEDNHLLVVEKPVNIPVQADQSKDKDLLSLLKQDLKVRYNKPGDVYLGLVQRLDRPVGGVLVFAKTSKAASRLSQQIANRQITKQYQAIVCGIAQSQNMLEDWLIKDRKTNTVTVTSRSNRNGKHARLCYQCLNVFNNLSHILIQLETGRSHQIRVQLASRDLPLWGDQRYNPHAKAGQQIALWSISLTLFHPITQEKMTFTSTPPFQYPWNSIKEDI